MTCYDRFCPARAASAVLAAALLGTVGVAVPEAAADGQIVIQPHLSGGRGRTPKNDVEYKVRDADGNLVARGWISPGDGESTATVDLPAGDYTVETYTDADDGTRLGGEADASVRDGGRTGKQVEVDPMSPQEVLEEEVEDLEDRIDELEGQVEHIEDDIRDHETRGEDDAVEQHQEEIDRIKENIERKKRQLRRKRRELNRLRRQQAQGANDPAPDAPHVRVPQTRGPMEPGMRSP